MALLCKSESKSIATGTIEAIEFNLPIQIPVQGNYYAKSTGMFLYGVSFAMAADVFPATTKIYTWNVAYQTKTSAHVGILDKDVIISHREVSLTGDNSHLTIQNRNYWFPQAILITDPKLYANCGQDSGGALTMGARMWYTLKEISAQEFLYSQRGSS